MQPHAAVIVFPGTNGDRDMHEALERAGFHVEDVPSHMPLPAHIHLAALPGGFSYGDYWRAGMLASQARAVQDIPALVARGGLAIGICNGFQILVEAGLLEGALACNNPPGFRHRWVEVVRTSQGMQSPWLRGLEAGKVLRMPMAHGEGRYVHPEGEQAVQGLVPFVYAQNHNGSMGSAAALLDQTGHVLGIMPHPERATDVDLGSNDGCGLFAAAHAWCAERGVL